MIYKKIYEGLKVMTRAGRRLIEDFLIPALNDGRYGDRLKWEDKEKLYFSIRWSHKNAAKWSEEDTEVFQDWDRLKGHFHPEVKGYFMQAKQRFRAALYKLNTVRKIKSDDKYVKKYQLVLENDKKKGCDYSGKPKIKKEKEAAFKQSCIKYIPTSVIKRNIYVEPKPFEIDCFSSAASTKSDSSVHSEDQPMKEYSCFTDRSVSPDSAFETGSLKTESKTDIPESCDKMKLVSVLQRQFCLEQKMPIKLSSHLPVQPIPVYANHSSLLLLQRSSGHSKPHSISSALKQQSFVLQLTSDVEKCNDSNDGVLNLCMRQPKEPISLPQQTCR